MEVDEVQGDQSLWRLWMFHEVGLLIGARVALHVDEDVIVVVEALNL
jgi:hypothetical protein